MIGGFGMGAFPMAGLIAKGVQVPSVLSLVSTRAQQWLQPWPWLEFYTITTENNGTLRYVDFQDPDAGGSLPELVPFNGEEFETRRIERTPIQSTADAVTSFSITFQDPTGDLVAILRDEDGLNRAQVQIDLIPYDLIDNPALALTETYRTRGASCSFAPSKVALEVGLPSLVDWDIPRRTYDRYRCWNDYQRRFVLSNACRAPSDDFNVGTEQLLGSNERNATSTTWPAAAQKRKFGWWSLNADSASMWKTSDVSLPAVFASDLWSTFESSNSILTHINTAQDGLFMWKRMSGDWAVETHVDFTDNVRAQRHGGILIQDDAGLTGGSTNWLFWGNARQASTTEVLRRRITTGGVSGNTDSADLSDGGYYFRVAYDSATTTFTMYVKPANNMPWVQKQQTTKNMGTILRVGLLASSDAAGATLMSVRFRFLRFTVGGPDDCDRSIEACQELGRDNEHQRNAFPGIPERATNF